MSYAQAVAPAQQPLPPLASQNVIVKHGKSHTELVQHYTTYYHHWNEQAGQARLALASLPPPHPNTPSNNAQREEMERREKWAAYYSSNSAALAHYHLALGKGGGEPYARPASPPVPPQITAGATGGGGAVGSSAAAVVGGGVGANINAPVAPAMGVTTISSTTTTSPSQKKKKRWASVQEETVSNGGSSSARATAAAADGNSSLYLNSFVQEGGQSSSTRNKRLVNDFYEQTNVTTTQSSASATHAGSKRKIANRYDSSLSANGSYYGPSTSSVTSGDYNEEDYVPLGLDRPLGASPGLSKKEKKKLKKAKASGGALSGGTSGFDSNQAALFERAHRFKGRGGIHDASNAKSSVGSNVEKYMGKTVIGGSNRQLDEHDYERMTVKGTCATLEKEYLRLTSPPRAELVRPQHILERHLENLKRSYRKGGKVHNGKVRDYDWYCSQFKAIRQDLTVQRITNAFAVDVYETHAKIALEEDDINEYNQSQTQLKELYDLIAGKENNVENRIAMSKQNEFIAYRIIYYVLLSGNRKYEGGSSDIFKIMLQLTPEQRNDECIHHALLVRAAVAENDYHKFFQLQDTAPNMGDYLMDKIVPSVRQSALQRICKAYRPSVDAKFVLKELGFDMLNRQEVEGGRAWLESCGCKFDGGVLLTKDTILTESAPAKNSLI